MNENEVQRFINFGSFEEDMQDLTPHEVALLNESYGD